MPPLPLHAETTIAALEAELEGRGRWELGGQALVTDETVVWICRPPEAELVDAVTIAWRASRRYAPRRRGFDAFVPAPLRRSDPAALRLVAGAADGTLVHLGAAHLGAYGVSGHGSPGEARFTLADPLTRDLWLELGGFRGIRLSGGDESPDLDADAVAGAVRELLARLPGGELWLSRWTGAALSVIFERERAFVMELAGPGDVGAVACDPGSAGDREPVAFTLDNGQVDEWPRAATVSRAQALDAIDAWVRERRAGGLDWTPDPPTP